LAAQSGVYNGCIKVASDKLPTHLTLSAVLTGDIIHSSGLGPRELQSVRLSLINAVGTVRGWKRGLVKGQIEFFRGDGWQLLVTHPAMAMRVGIFLRASLLAAGVADTRIAIGLGGVEKSSSQKVSLSRGPAFVLSGHALDNMTQYSSVAIEVPKSAGLLASWLPVVGHLCSSLIEQWTRRQAELVCAVIDPKRPDYETVAQTLKPAVSKQAVAKGLRGARWHAIHEAIDQFEDTPWEAVLGSDTLNGCLGLDNQKRLSRAAVQTGP